MPTQELQPFVAAPLDERIRYAKTLAAAKAILPRGLAAGTPDEVAAKVLLILETGATLGIPPVQALSSIHIIEGKPTQSASLMQALVRNAGHKLRVDVEGEGDSMVATATLTRRDDPHPFVVSFGMQDAKAAGLAGKDMYKKYQRNMLVSRAISNVCKEGAAEVLMGIIYTPEELGATVDADGNVIDMAPQQQQQQQQPARQTRQQRPQELEPIDVEPEPTVDWVAVVDSATSVEQLRALDEEAVSSGEGGLRVATGDTVRGYIRRRVAELRAAEQAAQAAEAAEGGDE